MNRLHGLALLFAAVTVAATAHAAGGRYDDAGVYSVYQGTRSLGIETFSFEPKGDSIFVFSRVQQLLPLGGERPDSLDKQVGIVFSADDFDLRGYESHQRLAGQYLGRKLQLKDTLYTAIREDQLGGSATVLVRPPGRVFVIDPQAFVLFDIIFRYMFTSSLDERPVPVVMLGVRDTVLEVRARRLGIEPIQWGSQTIQARKMVIGDAGSEFVAWMSPQGRMLRLTRDAVGLRVERQPEPAAAPRKKKAAAPAKRPG